MIEQLLMRFVAACPHISLIVGIVGALRLSVPVVMQAAKLIAEKTETKSDDRLIEEMEKSPQYNRFLAVLEWLTSVKIQ